MCMHVYRRWRPYGHRRALRRAPSGAQVKREVRDYVGEVLQPLYASKTISKEDYKLVAQKACENVLANTQPRPPGEAFLTPKRKAKIRDLVQKYVHRLSAGGAGQ